MSDRRGRRHAWRVGLAFFSIYVIWGSTFLVIRTALEHLPPLFLCGARLLLAGVVLAALVGLLLPAIGNGSVTIAETHVASGLVALLVASIPMWMALFAALGPHPIPLRPRVVAGLVTGLVGIALLVGPGHLAGARDVVDAGADRGGDLVGMGIAVVGSGPHAGVAAGLDRGGHDRRRLGAAG